MALAFMGLLPRNRGLLGRLAVSAEDARGDELPELVTHHVLGHVDRNELVAVVHRERVSHELGQDGAAAPPGLEHALFPAAVERLDLPREGLDDVRTLLDGTRHVLPAPLLLPAAHDERVAQLALPGLEALGDLAPRRRRMTSAGALAFAAAHRMVDGIHRDAAHAAKTSAPARASRLAVRNVF